MKSTLMRGQGNGRDISFPRADNPDPSYEQVIESRLVDAARNRGRHPQSLEAQLEVLLLEIAHRCGYRQAESARFLLVMRIAVEEANLAALDRRDDGLVNDVIPIIARSLVSHSTRRADVKD
jgi:hypothetical protein